MSARRTRSVIGGTRIAIGKRGDTRKTRTMTARGVTDEATSAIDGKNGRDVMIVKRMIERIVIETETRKRIEIERTAIVKVDPQ
ncbi:unnamed protein product [Haemonchus placei]|uniref:RNA-binding protein n=1 Tax=Haemonchus placei TaxID=6290 RepID=A0A0N4W301_HAEPC|nr:unnamed protein product [Haemonchus placei]